LGTKKDKPKRKNAPPPPGWVRGSEQYWKPHYEQIHQLMAARIRSAENGCRRGGAAKKDVLYDLIAIGVRFMDFGTGYERPDVFQPAAVPLHEVLRGPLPMIVNPYLPLAAQFVTPEEWANDYLLFPKMDKMPFMCWAGSLNNETMHVNVNIENFTGVPAAEFQGHRWVELIHPDDRDKTLKAFREGFASRLRSFRYPYRFRQFDGSYQYIMDTSQLRRQANGQLAYVGTMHLQAPPGSALEVLSHDGVSLLSKPILGLA
jgi:PAS domain S-box-containing protein